MTGDFTIGMIFAFQAYKQQFLDAATRLVDQTIQYKLLNVHLTRIADIALSPAASCWIASPFTTEPARQRSLTGWISGSTQERWSPSSALRAAARPRCSRS
jgi:hypothetical protein